MADRPLKILVAYDGSERSRRALAWTKRFADPDVAVITVLQTLAGSESISDAVDPGSAQIANRQNLEEVMAAALGVVPKLITAAGNPAEEIVGAAEAGGYDLVILSAQGMNAIERFLLGSVSARVVRYAPCPVLVVR